VVTGRQVTADDDETCRFEPIENPFGPKVLPVSPISLVAEEEDQVVGQIMFSPVRIAGAIPTRRVTAHG